MMKWINSSAGYDGVSCFNYVDSYGRIHGSVVIDHKTKKILWSIGDSHGPGRSVAHAKKVVERVAK